MHSKVTVSSLHTSAFHLLNKCILALFLFWMCISFSTTAIPRSSQFLSFYVKKNRHAGRMKCRGHSLLCFLCRVAFWKVLICSAEALGGPSQRRLLCEAAASPHRLHSHTLTHFSSSDHPPVYPGALDMNPAVQSLTKILKNILVWSMSQCFITPGFCV